jgi:hypothetical protein
MIMPLALAAAVIFIMGCGVAFFAVPGAFR